MEEPNHTKGADDQPGKPAKPHFSPPIMVTGWYTARTPKLLHAPWGGPTFVGIDVMLGRCLLLLARELG